jgi:hypothetical protein
METISGCDRWAHSALEFVAEFGEFVAAGHLAGELVEGDLGATAARVKPFRDRLGFICDSLRVVRGSARTLRLGGI